MPEAPTPARPTLRERKQQAAREHVADAAAPLFVEHGYVGTTTREVARVAGVAEGTVYNLFGSKSGLLLAALQRSVPDRQTGEAWRAEAASLPGARQVVEHFCVTGATVSDRALPLVRTFLQAAAVDDEVAAAWREQEEFRLDGQRWLLTALAERGWLRRDRHVDDLARDLWVLSAPEAHLKCLDSGMSEEDFQRWHLGVLILLLVDPTAR